MSADAARLISEYDGRSELRSGARHILQMAKGFPGVTAEQKGQIDKILKGAQAAKKQEVAEPPRDVHAEKMQELADQEAAIQQRELTVDLNVALTAAGASGQGLEDARVLLDVSLAGSRDPQMIRDQVDALLGRHPQFFGAEPPAPVPPRRRGALPSGGPNRDKVPVRSGPGAAGRAEARRRGFVND